MKINSILLLLACITFQCTQPKYPSCEDVLFSKQKHEQYKKNNFRKNGEVVRVKKERIKDLLLEMPFNNLTASLNDEPYLNLEPLLVRNFEKSILNRDTTNRKVDSLKQELLKAQIRVLELEHQQMSKAFESGEPTVNTKRRDPRQEKASKLGGASLALSIIGGALLIPALSAVGSGFIILVLLLDLIALGLGISSLVKYDQTENKTGKGKAIWGIALIFGVPVFLFLMLLLWFTIFWGF